ncbi:MAG: hypothetical protein JRL30_06030 [Deltaproteobacteria bacterium]|nr:hypothetical protein [Deltaproteobacteria bacterium]
MKFKTKLLIGLVIIAVLDMIVPIPFAALLLLYVVIEKPPWFQRLVADLYEAESFLQYVLSSGRIW